jgi:hypothetical protein
MIELSVQNGAEQTFQSDLKGRAWPARAAEPMLAPPPAVLNIISVGKVATRAEQLSHRTHLLLSFPYVCPEPALVKRSFLV